MEAGDLYKVKYDVPNHSVPSPNSPSDNLIGKVLRGDVVILLDWGRVYSRVISRNGVGWTISYALEEL